MMGKIITCTGEYNTGVTTTALFFTKCISNLTEKSVLLIDMNDKKDDIYKYLAGSDNPRYNLDIIMNYALSEKKLESTIKTNAEKMNNSLMEIIMGSLHKQGYDDEQYKNLFNQVERMYDYTILDISLPFIPQVILDYSANVLLIVDQNKKSLNDIMKTQWKLVKEDKTDVIVNKFDSRIMSLDKIDKIIGKDTLCTLAYDRKIIKAMNKGCLSLDDSTYCDNIEHMARKILKRYGTTMKDNNSIFSKLFKKNKTKEDVVIDAESK